MNFVETTEEFRVDTRGADIVQAARADRDCIWAAMLASTTITSPAGKGVLHNTSAERPQGIETLTRE
jgi:hypothetical protein